MASLLKPLRPLNPMHALRNVHAEPNARGLLSVYVFSPEKNRWIRAPYSKDTTAPALIRVLTWNVDFMAPRAELRLNRVLEHIQHDVFKCIDGNIPEPCMVLLQEIEAEAIPVLLSNEWVRSHFQVTPISKWNWPNHAHYGNITLIARSIPIQSASSLVFMNSHMARNALIVDVNVNPSSGAITESIGNDPPSSSDYVTIRIGNVHLESLPQGTSARPQQLARVSEALKESGITAGLVCGDMNAIMECDKDIPPSLGLRDACGKGDDDPDGHTWGYQPACNFPPGRLDKILYTPEQGLLVLEPERVGVGLKTLEGQWASDHYGLLTSVSLSKMKKLRDKLL